MGASGLGATGGGAGPSARETPASAGRATSPKTIRSKKRSRRARGIVEVAVIEGVIGCASWLVLHAAAPASRARDFRQDRGDRLGRGRRPRTPPRRLRARPRAVGPRRG